MSTIMVEDSSRLWQRDLRCCSVSAPSEIDITDRSRPANQKPSAVSAKHRRSEFSLALYPKRKRISLGKQPIDAFRRYIATEGTDYISER